MAARGKVGCGGWPAGPAVHSRHACSLAQAARSPASAAAAPPHLLRSWLCSPARRPLAHKLVARAAAAPLEGVCFRGWLAGASDGAGAGGSVGVCATSSAGGSRRQHGARGERPCADRTGEPGACGRRRRAGRYPRRAAAAALSSVLAATHGCLTSSRPPGGPSSPASPSTMGSRCAAARRSRAWRRGQVGGEGWGFEGGSAAGGGGRRPTHVAMGRRRRARTCHPSAPRCACMRPSRRQRKPGSVWRARTCTALCPWAGLCSTHAAHGRTHAHPHLPAGIVIRAADVASAAAAGRLVCGCGGAVECRQRGCSVRVGPRVESSKHAVCKCRMQRSMHAAHVPACMLTRMPPHHLRRQRGGAAQKVVPDGAAAFSLDGGVLQGRGAG